MTHPAPSRRRSLRLRGYDYSQAGMYFVTACTEGRASLFGEVIHDEMHVNDAGKAVETVWDSLPRHYPHIVLDAFVVMTNHMHGILAIAPMETGVNAAPTAHGLPEIVRAFKTFSSRRINEIRQTQGSKIWQRSFWDRVIRNDDELSLIREYIQNNPVQWMLDRLHPQSTWSGRTRGGDARAGLKPAPTDVVGGGNG